MSEIKINNKVWILSSQKTDGRYNKGVVIGLEKTYEFLGYVSESQFIRDHKLTRAKVAFVDVSTKKGCAEWFSLRELSKYKPNDATA